MELSTAIRILASIAEQHGGDIPDHILTDWEQGKAQPKTVRPIEKRKKKEPELNEMQLRNQKIVMKFFNGNI